MFDFLLRPRLRHNIDWMNLNWFLGALRFFYPVGILYFAENTGSYTAAMGVFSLCAIVQILFEIPTGILSDRFGRVFVLRFGCIIEFFAIIAYAMAPTGIFFDPWIWIYIGGALFGLTDACFSGTTHAILYETLLGYRQEKNISKVIGRSHSMGQIGLAVSGAIAATVLWLGYDYHTLVILTLIPFFLCVVTSFMVVEPPKHSIQESTLWAHTQDAFHLILRHKKIRLLTIGDMLKDGIGNSIHSFMPQFIATVWPQWSIPLYRLAQNAIGAIGFWKAARFIKFFGASQSLIGSEISMKFLSLSGVMMANIFSPFFLVLSQIGYAVGTTAADTLKQENFTNHQRATLSSLISFASSLSWAGFALLLGMLADALSPQMALVIMIVIGMPTIWVYSLLYSHHKKG